jgi:hypothetical protein
LTWFYAEGSIAAQASDIAANLLREINMAKTQYFLTPAAQKAAIPVFTYPPWRTAINSW